MSTTSACSSPELSIMPLTKEGVRDIENKYKAQLFDDEVMTLKKQIRADLTILRQFPACRYTKVDAKPMPKDLQLFKGAKFVSIDDSSKAGEDRTDL